MSRGLPPMFDPANIRARADLGLSLTSDLNAHRCQMWRGEEVKGLLEDLAKLAEVECRFTKGKPEDAAGGEGVSHVKVRTGFGWVHLLHVQGRGGERDPDYDRLQSLLSYSANGYWEIYG